MVQSRIKPANPWVLPQERSDSTKLDLFCFPCAGAGASFFRPWQSLLSEWVTVRPVQLPGREVRLQEPPISDLRELVSELMNGLEKELGARPFVFFGHSMGALLAYELTQQLRMKGLPGPRQIFVSGRTGPQCPWRDPPIRHLPDDEFVQGVLRLNGIPEEVVQHPELMELLLPALRADFTLCETYSYAPQPALDCPITVYGGLDDPETDRPGLEAWSEQTHKQAVVRMFPGNHFFLHSSRDLFIQSLKGDLLGVTESLKVRR